MAFKEPANKHYSASLAKMGLVKEVIASEDICDEFGTKLWAKGKPIDPRLWEKLSGRALRQPLEASVSTADPLTHIDVAESIERQVATKPHLKTLIESKLSVILARIQKADFNSAEQMMLSLLRHGQRDIFDHACAVAAAAMCFGAHANFDTGDLDRLLHAGVLHDVGEIYLDPELFSRRELSIADQRELLLHPALGGMITREVLRRTSNIAYAIEQSHERLDGSGYPSGLPAKALTPLAPALLTAESIIGLVMNDSAGIQHAAIALRLNPGEFPDQLVTLVNSLSQQASTQRASEPLPPAMRERMINATYRNEQADILLAQVLRQAPLSPAQRSALTRAEIIIKRCSRALNSTGLSQLASVAQDTELSVDPAEAEAITREIEYRLNVLSRDIEIGFLDQRKPDLVTDLLAAIEPQQSVTQAATA